MLTQISNELVLEVIDKGLSSIGERPKQALWFCLENDLNIERQKIPENLEAFEQALQRFFGLGFNFLAELFVRYLSDALGEDFGANKNLSECVNLIRLRSDANVVVLNELRDSMEFITDEDQKIQ